MTAPARRLALPRVLAERFVLDQIGDLSYIDDDGDGTIICEAADGRTLAELIDAANTVIDSTHRPRRDRVKRPPIRPRPCLACGDEFAPKSERNIYCCRDCQLADRTFR